MVPVEILFVRRHGYEGQTTVPYAVQYDVLFSQHNDIPGRVLK